MSTEKEVASVEARIRGQESGRTTHSGIPGYFSAMTRPARARGTMVVAFIVSE